RIHVESGQIWNLAQKIKGLLETFILVLVSFYNADDFASGAVPWKRVGKTRGLLSVIFGAQHASNHGHFGTCRYANHRYSFSFGFINQRRESLRISRRENDSVHALPHELLERFRVRLSQRLNRPVYKLDSVLCHTASFIQHAAP